MKKARILFFTITLMFLVVSTGLFAQKGEPPPRIDPDTTFVFDSPRPLVDLSDVGKANLDAWGFDLLLSNNGFGGGFFYQRSVGKKSAVFADLYLSGARNSDEFDDWDYTLGEWRVPGKINRLFMFPLMFGGQHRLLDKTLTKTLMPFISTGVGPTLIVSTPYKEEFFKSFKYADLYGRFGGFLGAGAYFGTRESSLSNVQIRYYYIPFGGEGLESIEDLPIKNFGGVFLSLSVGFKY